ncbi:MAG TPA: carboxypeptidase-like regulatory domain-containing protein, partial [Cyclobacteriaceae bacterium]|nr:carboxypeptidase-like regulatory domain-containing protein [Cyclobacteriaceae bacterium]
IKKRIKTGPLGVGNLTFTGEYVFNTLPYPLLTLHLGNQSPFYSSVTYNLMDFGEFVSDHYFSLQYRQYLEGFLLNRVPLLNKLKWRLLATTNVIVGGMRQSNRDLISLLTPTGETASQVGYFNEGKPYMEVGYGIENIFKIFRVDFIHRLSYLDKPDARKFGVFFTAQLQL